MQAQLCWCTDDEVWDSTVGTPLNTRENRGCGQKARLKSDSVEKTGVVRSDLRFQGKVHLVFCFMGLLLHLVCSHSMPVYIGWACSGNKHEHSPVHETWTRQIQ